MYGDRGVVTQQGTTEESIDNTGVGIAKNRRCPYLYVLERVL
jgi:hypothetical protein